MSNKKGSLSGAVRMYCGECQELRTVKDINNQLSEPICWFVGCSHTRTAAAPKRPGRISLEELGTEDGQRLFKAERKAAYDPSYGQFGAADEKVVLSEEPCADEEMEDTEE